MRKTSPSTNGEDPATFSAPDQVVAAILGTREGANEAGYQLLSTGVTWSDQQEAAELRDALAARKVENVMLVSAFLAAAALAQTMGSATGYARAALLYIEPDTATLAVVDTADGSITDVHRELLPEDDDRGRSQAGRAGFCRRGARRAAGGLVGGGLGSRHPADQARAGGRDVASAERARAARRRRWPEVRRWRRRMRRCSPRRPLRWPMRWTRAPVR